MKKHKWSVFKTWAVSLPQLAKKADVIAQFKVLNLALKVKQVIITISSVPVVIKAEGGKRTSWVWVSWGQSIADMCGPEGDTFDVMMLWHVEVTGTLAGWRQDDTAQWPPCEGQLSCKGFGAASALVTTVCFWVLEKKEEEKLLSVPYAEWERFLTWCFNVSKFLILKSKSSIKKQCILTM